MPISNWHAYSSLTLLSANLEGHPACKRILLQCYIVSLKTWGIEVIMEVGCCEACYLNLINGNYVYNK